MMWKPQILAAMLILGIIAIVVILLEPDHIEVVAGGCVTGVGMLGMKLLEKE